MNKGLQWHKKKFTVPLQVVKKDNPCWSCANNKYHGGQEQVCDDCVGNANYQGKN